LFPQTLPADYVAVTLPPSIRKYDSDAGAGRALPPDLQQKLYEKKLVFVNAETDLGGANKVLWLLSNGVSCAGAEEGGGSSGGSPIMLVVDDDIEYPPSFVAELHKELKRKNAEKPTAVGFSGGVLNKLPINRVVVVKTPGAQRVEVTELERIPNAYHIVLNTNAIVDTLQGFGGIMFASHFIPRETAKQAIKIVKEFHYGSVGGGNREHTKEPLWRFRDDFVHAALLEKNGIRRICVALPGLETELKPTRAAKESAKHGGGKMLEGVQRTLPYLIEKLGVWEQFLSSSESLLLGF